MEFVLAVIVLAGIVALVVLHPLRGAGERSRIEEDQRAALEAAKEAKYREIRDAEHDQRTGKLSEGDHRVLDGELRAEAVALLKRIDAVRARLGAEAPPVTPPPAVS